MKISRYIVIVLTLVLLQINNLSAQIYNPDLPVIEDFVIDANTINDIIDKKYGPLTFCLGKQQKLSRYIENNPGFVIIPPSYYKHDGRSLGIVVTYSMIENFSAFELRCPNCYYRYHKDCAMKAITIYGMLECPTCGAQVDALFAYNSGLLTAYDPGRGKSPTCLDGYCIDVIEDGDNVSLRIYNSPAAKKR